MGDRWSKGDTLHQIGKLFDRPHTSIHNILAATGGIRSPWLVCLILTRSMPSAANQALEVRLDV